MNRENVLYLGRGILWNSISQFGLIGVQFIATILLGRILTPDDYGMLGIMSIFIAISNMIIDSGMGGALIRKKDVTYRDYSTLFFYNFIVSIVLYIVLFITAPYIASFYEKIELEKAIRTLGLVIIIYAFCIVQNVKMAREMKFGTLAIVNCLSGIISLVVTVIFAIKDFGYWALIIQQIVTSFCNTLFLSICSKFIPSFDFSKECFREQFKFGINLLSSNLLRTISGNINSNIVAKLVSLNQVGCFFQANRLVSYFDNIYSGVLDKSIFPVFARIENRKELLENHIKLLRYVLSITFPICVLISLLSYQIIIVLLGTQWQETCWMFELLIFSMMPVLVQILIRNILKSLGNTRQILNNEVVKSIITMFTLFLGMLFSLAGVIWGLIVSHSISAIWMMKSMSNEFGISIVEQVKIIGGYVLSNLSVYLLVKSIVPFLSITNVWWYVLMVCGLCMFFTLTISAIFQQK